MRASRPNYLNVFTQSHKFTIRTLKSEYYIFHVNNVNTIIIQRQAIPIISDLNNQLFHLQHYYHLSVLKRNKVINYSLYVYKTIWNNVLIFLLVSEYKIHLNISSYKYILVLSIIS